MGPRRGLCATLQRAACPFLNGLSRPGSPQKCPVNRDRDMAAVTLGSSLEERMSRSPWNFATAVPM